jgi:hypothetical protein
MVKMQPHCCSYHSSVHMPQKRHWKFLTELCYTDYVIHTLLRYMVQQTDKEKIILSNSVRREVLYNILIEIGIPMKLVRLIKMCLNETYCNVYCVWHATNNFTSLGT